MHSEAPMTKEGNLFHQNPKTYFPVLVLPLGASNVTDLGIVMFEVGSCEHGNKSSDSIKRHRTS
jgi:hypothetical protein